MIIYVCDSCKTSIQAAEIKAGDAILMGEKAFCPSCNPRRKARHEASGALGALACDGCGAGIGPRALRLGEARIQGGQFHCEACLSGRRQVPGRTLRPRRDGAYLAGVVGIFLVLPLVSALVTWKVTRGASGEPEVAQAPDLLSQVEALREDNSGLESRITELGTALEEARAELETRSREQARAPSYESQRINHTLNQFERTVSRLEDGLAAMMTREQGTGAADLADTGTPAVAPPVAPAEVSVPAPGPPDTFSALLAGLAEGRVPHGLDLAGLIDDEDPSIRALACKLAGAVGSGSRDAEVDLMVLRRLMKHMRDPDTGVQRSALTAASKLTGERYVAWHEVSADQYKIIAHLRQLWDSVRQNEPTDGPAPGDHR